MSYVPPSAKYEFIRDIQLVRDIAKWEFACGARNGVSGWLDPENGHFHTTEEAARIIRQQIAAEAWARD